MDEAHGKEDSPAEIRRRWKLASPRMLAGWAAVVFLFLLITPYSRYLLRAAWEESWILLRRRSIATIVGDSTVARVTRAKLGVVLAARAYAADSLGLDAGKSFTKYSALKRDTLVLVLSAAYRDTLAFYRWWFPIVGRVPYKGYFAFDEARRAESRLRDQGFDTQLRPASAFSTLGWFNDPLLSTTLRADSLYLANTVIHELTHNEYFASGQVEFNESFANFVGARGSAEFFRRRGSRGAAAEADARWSDEKALAAFWHRLYMDIDSVFKANPGDSAKHVRLTLRDSVYRAAKKYLVFTLAPALHTVSPTYLERLQLDNATLLAGRIYETDLALFDSVFVREGSDTRRSVQRIIALARSEPGAPFDAVRKWVRTAPRGP